MDFDRNWWAVIIGGSSGFGLAAAKKLAACKMNVCIVHRDRRSAMKKIEPEFERLRETGVEVLTFNLDGLSEEGRTRVLDGLCEQLGKTGKVRMLLHSVAFGNLKLLGPYPGAEAPASARAKIAADAGLPKERIDEIVADAFAEGFNAAYTLVDDADDYSNRQFLGSEDFSRTLHAMGYNIVEWVQDIMGRGLFAKDARVLSLTSEGNSVAWKGYAAISAAKAVLESVTRAMAVEFAPRGLRANVIQAGITDTPALQAIPGSARIRAQASLRNPFGRLTTPEDVANVICLLCTDEASWINGAIICADGGERIG
ncbi:MAG: SDR family oxidoreductase [Desulfobacteraceae bacterium]|nr:SDR family oxidoreductase [Desulfobacteraceae bacterium]